MMLKILSFSTSPFKLPFLLSIQVGYDFFAQSKTVLTFRCISSPVPEVLVSIVFTLLFDRMPREVTGILS